MVWSIYFWAFGVFNAVLMFLTWQNPAIMPTKVAVYLFVAIILQFSLFGLIHQTRFGSRWIWKMMIPFAAVIWVGLMANHVFQSVDALMPHLFLSLTYAVISVPALLGGFIYAFRRYPQRSTARTHRAQKLPGLRRA